MRIGLVAPPWVPTPPPAYGGTEAVVDRLARGLVAAGHDVVLFATGDSTCPVPTRWVFEEAVPAMGNVVAEVRHVLAAYDELRDMDIVHDHTNVGPLYAAAFPDLPVLTTNHGPFEADLHDIYRRLSGRVPIVAISHDQARTAGDIPIAQVIHHGVDPDLFPVGTGGDGHLLFLGRMSRTKGVHEAVAVARAAGRPLLIAAKMREPAEREYFEAAVRPLLGGDVEYIGEATGREKLELLAGAVALLNPIRWHEPFGLVMIEALACGTPVLAYAEGAAPEIVEHGVTGYLCRDADDMVGKVGRLEQLDRAACRRAVEDYFCTERMVAEHLELYEWLMLSASRARARPVVDLRSAFARPLSSLETAFPPPR